MDNKKETALITFIVTNDCQLRCKYCYEIEKNNKSKISINIAKKAIDDIIDNLLFTESCESVVFDFIGGEPLLEIDLIDKICAYIDDKFTLSNHVWKDKYSFSITTNGLLYSSKKVQNFITRHKSKLKISISFDGNKVKHDLNRVFPNGKGSYDLVLQNVKLWISQFEDTSAKMVISKADINDVAASAIHLLELGISRLDMNLVVEDLWLKGDDDIFEEQLIILADYIIQNELYLNHKIYIFEEGIGHSLKKEEIISPCEKYAVTVDCKGNYFTCLRFSSFALKNKQERTIGNIYTGLNWNRLRPFYTMFNYLKNPEKCQDCKIASGCRFCVANDYDFAESTTIFTKETNICLMHAARVRAKNYYWRKLMNYEYRNKKE